MPLLLVELDIPYDGVSDGVQQMICHLENHVITTGLADMIGAAATISTVCHLMIVLSTHF